MASFKHDDTFKQVAEVIVHELKIDREKLVPSVTFQELGADSLDMVQLIMKLEDRFGIEINDDDAEAMQTLADVVTYIHERRTA